MIQSNPLSGILNQQNANQGPNPYQQQAAGLLQQIMAQHQQQQAQLFAQAAAVNQQEANKMGGNMGNIAKGIKDMLAKNNPTIQADSATPIATMNDPNPMESDQPPPRIPIDQTGIVTPSQPSPGLSEMLPKLTAAAKTAYPDNPTMQQVSVTQAILESGLQGRPSSLATQHNNYFGIKANKSFPGTGGTVDLPTQEFVGGSPTTMNQGFATNNSMGDSFAQHAALMNGSSRYGPVLQATSPVAAFGALGKSGYATDPNYAAKLRALHSQFVAPLYG